MKDDLCSVKGCGRKFVFYCGWIKTNGWLCTAQVCRQHATVVRTDKVICPAHEGQQEGVLPPLPTHEIDPLAEVDL